MMKRSYKYVRAFSITFIFSAVSFGLLMGIRFDFWNGLQAGLLFGIILNSVLAIIFLPIDYVSTRNLPDKALQVCQDRDISVVGDFDHIYQICMDALKSYKHVKRVEPQKESMLIEARTKQSPYSFGENIKLLFSEMAPQKVTIHISSYPVGRYILLDFGKNYKNVEYIGESINERLSEKKL